MKGILQISCIRDIKSTHSAGVRSIPKVQRSGYLDLYLLRREKIRLEQEIFALDKRIDSATMQLGSIKKRIERLQKEMQEEQKIKTCRDTSKKPLKTMAINY